MLWGGALRDAGNSRGRLAFGVSRFPPWVYSLSFPLPCARRSFSSVQYRTSFVKRRQPASSPAWSEPTSSSATPCHTTVTTVTEPHRTGLPVPHTLVSYTFAASPSSSPPTTTSLLLLHQPNRLTTTSVPPCHRQLLSTRVELSSTWFTQQAPQGEPVERSPTFPQPALQRAAHPQPHSFWDPVCGRIKRAQDRPNTRHRTPEHLRALASRPLGHFPGSHSTTSGYGLTLGYLHPHLLHSSTCRDRESSHARPASIQSRPEKQTALTTSPNTA
ncbi:hypothetical protein BKA56DRAFT_341477 [Ilyonectria sp. MPI-CAGE-AT-0026]|nr:hypothetical protein BKA56DRAFT_341477 [Ilyonectria sp. MPI-CAGE-AT-0026]